MDGQIHILEQMNLNGGHLGFHQPTATDRLQQLHIFKEEKSKNKEFRMGEINLEIGGIYLNPRKCPPMVITMQRVKYLFCCDWQQKGTFVASKRRALLYPWCISRENW
jgi:hypothetical protein